MGNPPFIPTASIAHREAIEKRFKSAKGRYDSSSLFVELALNKLRDGGAIGLVVPNRLFANASAQSARDVVRNSARIDTLVDFGSTKVFEGVTAYIGLLVAEKNGHQAPDLSLQFVRVKALSEAYALEPVARAIFERSELTTPDLDAFRMPQPAKGEAWTSVSPELRILISSLESAGVQLSELADVKQGIKTGNNKIFLLRLASEPAGSVVQVEDGDGNTAFVERDLLKPSATSTSVTRYRAFGRPEISDEVILYPYDENGIIQEETLLANFPATHEYLSRHKVDLASRASALGPSQPWYSLVRARDVKWLNAAKLLARDLIPGPEFAVDQGIGVHLIGGTAVVPYDLDHLFPLLGLMNSPRFDPLLRNAFSEYRGNFIKVEPGRLMGMYIPSDLIEDAEFVEAVSRRLTARGVKVQEAELEIDSFVDRYFGELSVKPSSATWQPPNWVSEVPAGVSYEQEIALLSRLVSQASFAGFTVVDPNSLDFETRGYADLVLQRSDSTRLMFALYEKSSDSEPRVDVVARPEPRRVGLRLIRGRWRVVNDSRTLDPRGFDELGLRGLASILLDEEL